MNMHQYLQLEHDIANLISSQVQTFSRLHIADTEAEQEAASAEFDRCQERLRELLERADHGQLKRAILGATVIY